MSMQGVLRPGLIQLRVLDMEAALVHYIDRIGLNEVCRDDKGRVFLKGWDEFDHHSFVLREADTAGLDFFAFKVDTAESLAVFRKRIEDWGLVIDDVPAGEHPGVQGISFYQP